MAAFSALIVALIVSSAVSSNSIATEARSSPSTPELRVRNLGQAGMVSSPPQPALELGSRGSCDAVLTAEQIDQQSSPCEAGTWPENGSGAWAPRLHIAAGDTIALEFDRPMTAVRYSATTDAPPGVTTTPDGIRGPSNKQLLGPADAVRDGDGTRWLVQLPNPVDPLVRTGANVSVVATAQSGSSDFAFSLKSPRAASYGTGGCGPAWYAPGDVTSTCPQAPPGTPPVAPGSPPENPAADDGSSSSTPAKARPGQLRDRVVTVRNGSVRVRVVESDAARVRLVIRYHGRLVGSGQGRANKTLRIRLRSYVRRRLARSGVLKTRARIVTCDSDSCRRVTRNLKVVLPGSR